jgi:hypothetical protein
MINCVDMCPYADEKQDCNGDCMKIDTEDEGISYDVDEMSIEHRSPLTIVIGDEPTLNGGW